MTATVRLSGVEAAPDVNPPCDFAQGDLQATSLQSDVYLIIGIETHYSNNSLLQQSKKKQGGSAMKFLQIILTLLIAIVSFGQSRTLEETVEKQFDFDSGGLVTLKNVNGKVAVEGWDKNEVYMVAVKRVKAGSREDAQKLMERVKIEIEESNGEIYIRTRLPRKNGNFWDWAFGDGASASVRYTLQVPHDCNLRIESTNGSVEAADVNGDIRLESTNGKIRANDIGGELNAHTTNGSIKAEMTAIDDSGEMDLTTTNGSIKLYLPANAAFDVKAKTTNGSVDCDFPISVKSHHNKRRRLEGSVNGGGVRLFLETTNGGISIWER